MKIANRWLSCNYKYFTLLAFLCAAPAMGSDFDLAGSRYVDANGFFSLLPPSAWRIQQYPNEVRGKVAFLEATPNVELRVLAKLVDFNSLEELIGGARDTEQRLGITTHIERMTFNGLPAMSRRLQYQGLELYLVDFVFANAHHNIQFGARPADFKRYLSLAKQSMATYEPRPIQRIVGVTLC